MDPQYEALRVRLSHDLIQVSIRIGLVALAFVICLQIFRPFAPIMIWALILAVSLNPLNQKLAGKFKGSASRAATAIVVAGLLLLGVPSILLGLSFANHAIDIFQGYQAGTLAIEPPAESIREWPLVGEKIYAAWLEASQSLPAAVEDYKEPLRKAVSSMASAASGTLGTVFLFLGALIIAGVMMAYGESGNDAMLRVTRTLVGEQRGTEVHTLSIATIRSVAMGVIGVAFIQALLLGVGFMFAGVPAAGLLALVILVLGILQLPAAVITLPVIGWMWSAGDNGTVLNVVLTVYLVLAGFSDGVLKPMLLGRGVDVPMPVVLLGALGGMVSMGLVGLFVGAVVLSVAYRLFMAWVDREHPVRDDAGEA